MTSEVFDYYVRRSKVLDIIEPNILKLKSSLDRIEDNPWNTEEERLTILNEVIKLVKLFERENGIISTLL